jgi:Pyruvate:ferredoxin oxidoreductase and related 2-oxoacid:ferredoxin oxidoreductases, gamma subunit
MKCDMVLCGVGGQGGISVSVIIAEAAMAAGLSVKQAEIHGMAQRGGGVVAQLRLSDSSIASPSIPEGCADLLIAFEPLEALRYLPLLSPSARLVSAKSPVLNIPSYPELESVLARLREIPRARIVDADAIAKEAGSARAANMALVGAVSEYLPFPPELIEREIERSFGRKGEAVVQANLRAFEYGRKANR